MNENGSSDDCSFGLRKKMDISKPEINMYETMSKENVVDMEMVSKKLQFD